MKRVLLATLAVLPLIACGGPAPEGEEIDTAEDAFRWNPDVLINFDQVTFNSPLLGPVTTFPGNGEIVDTLYSNYGVTFSCAGPTCPTPHAYVRSSVLSGNNSVSVFPTGV